MPDLQPGLPEMPPWRVEDAPGGDKARERGCTCPVLDNGYGRGRGNGTYVIVWGCPVHSPEKDDDHATT
jgi:hypothetical protein